MKPDQLLRSILPEVLIDNFDIDRFEKSDSRFDIWLDEKNEQLSEDKYNKNIICYGFGDYRTIQDYPIRGRATYLHVRKRKWLDKSTGASLVNDRFHVQRLIPEAVDQLKIRHRWEVLDAENKAIREHRRRRKNAALKEERELIGQWDPERMENGETMPQIMACSQHIILKHKSKWNGQQKIRAGILFRIFPDLGKAYGLLLKLVDIFNEKTSAGVARLNLARWYNEVEAFGNNEFNKVLETFENHNTTIINYFERRLTNASAESFNAKIKAFRTQFRGVGDIKFFMFRLPTLYY